MLSGNLSIHKKVETRPARAVAETDAGSLMVWDSLPEGKWYWRSERIVHETEDGIAPYEPDIIVRADEWTRVEKEGHGWSFTNPETIRQMAQDRDDVDEDDVNI